MSHETSNYTQITLDFYQYGVREDVKCFGHWLCVTYFTVQCGMVVTCWGVDQRSYFKLGPVSTGWVTLCRHVNNLNSTWPSLHGMCSEYQQKLGVNSHNMWCSSSVVLQILQCKLVFVWGLKKRHCKGPAGLRRTLFGVTYIVAETCDKMLSSEMLLQYSSLHFRCHGKPSLLMRLGLWSW